MTMLNGIQDSGPNNLLARRLNVADRSDPASSLAPELFATFDAVGYSEDQEYLRDTRLCSGYCDTTGGVATYGGYRLTNDEGTNILAVVKRILLRNPNAGQVCTWHLTNTLTRLGAPSYPRTQFIDARAVRDYTLNQGTVCVASQGEAGAPAAYGIGGLVGAETLDIPLGIILKPGSSFELWASAVNTAFQVTVFWTERKAQPSELV